ncbi:lysr family regulatory protein [Colletotrichum incanum]|nr:lysr family regulatory protein [Colletotrichum incanum]
MVACSNVPNKLENLDVLMTFFRRYFQIRDDYTNLMSDEYTKSKGFCEDLDEGKYSYIMIHTLENCDPKSASILQSILQQRREKGLAGIDDDAMASVGTAELEREPYVLGPKIFSAAAKLWFALRFLWDVIWCPRTKEKAVCIPPAMMKQIKQQAQDDLRLAEESREDGGDDAPFISENDVLTAWLIRIITQSQRGSRPVTARGTVDVRGRLPSVFFPSATEEEKSKVYVQNLSFELVTLLSVEDCNAPSSLGHTAIKVRESIMQQATEAQLRAQAQAHR